jgi:hypothetical protein
MIDQLIQSGHRHKRSKKHFAAQQTSVKIAANDCFPPKDDVRCASTTQTFAIAANGRKVPRTEP